MSTEPATLRCLVACPGCRRQFDVSGLAQGSRFHCACGGIIEVPQFLPQDAKVVRCSSCSAPRRKGAPACEHCGADYTLHEQDLHTICPACMARVSDRARFCHRCAVPITPAGDAGSETTKPCAVCARKSKLRNRTLGDPPLTVLECNRCAGLWLTRQAFEILTERARNETVQEKLLEVGEAEGAGTSPAAATFYRRCPDCRKHMHRRNFGRKSGVLVDICKEHGLWFDAQELAAILRWIRDGGEARARRMEQLDQRERERQTRIKVDPTANIDMEGQRTSKLHISPSLFREMLGTLFDL